MESSACPRGGCELVEPNLRANGHLTILVTDRPGRTLAIEESVLGRLGARLLDGTELDDGALEEVAVEADAILTCFRLVTDRMIQSAPRLRAVGRYGVGVDNIDVSSATKRGIPVTNVPVYCTDEVAEHTLAMLLALRRDLRSYDDAVRAGRWERWGPRPLHRVAGSTIGIVGLGQIGAALARRCAGIGMTVLATDHHADSTYAHGLGCELTDLDDLFARSDVVSLHVPLTRATRHLVNVTRLSLMKQGAVLINCSRGQTVDSDALVGALQSGQLAAAGLDVFESEPLGPAHPLLDLPNVLLTPHVAFYSEESIGDLQRIAAENVARALEGAALENAVNGAALRERTA